tara:strand:- start:1937 stop:2197 length:261 start_codon:yes stop_codon:yes gene_type:complete
MSDRVYGVEEKAKLERLVNEGATVLQEVTDLQEGLKETVKAVAEELNIKPALINKAIKVAHKGDWDKVQDEFEDLETLIVTVGKDK